MIGTVLEFYSDHQGIMRKEYEDHFRFYGSRLVNVDMKLEDTDYDLQFEGR